MRTFYDSVTASDIPAHAEGVGGYVDGAYKWSAADWARFPHAAHVRIAVSPFTNDGNVLDVERGDATPAQAPAWVYMRRRAGVDPTIYVQQSTLPQVRAAFHVAQIAQPHYWVASWGIGPTAIPGAVAHQYDHPPTSGGHYDLTAVPGTWPGVDNAGVPNPPPPLPVPPSSDSSSREDLSVSEAQFIYSQLAKVAAVVGVALEPMPTAAPAGKRVYVVQGGDSLSGIAAQYLHDASKWHEIYELNKSAIGNDPNLIHPGLHLELPDA